MALYYSTCLRNFLASRQGRVKAFFSGATLDYYDNGGSPDTITESGNGLITAGFAPNMLITTKNATTGGNNITNVTLTAVVAGTLSFATGTLAGTEVFPAAGCVIGCSGGSLRDILMDGVINIYNGSIPASADAATAGNIVATITLSSAAWAAGAFANGLELGDAVAGVVSKVSGEVWSGAGLINPSGSMTYFRWVANASDPGTADTTPFLYPRIQGTVGVGTSYNLNVSSTALALSVTLTIDTASFTFPASV